MARVKEKMVEATDSVPERFSSTRLGIGAVVAETYRIVGRIGSGGSSHVFEAEHVRLGKRFAVKVLRPELDPTRLAAQRFRREIRAVARLNSEHIVNVIDCGELEDGTPYLVMERLYGEDLRSLLDREGALPVRRAVALVVEACRGLSAVHAARLVHRDLKPENLFISKRSTGEDWCKVLDFGVAKMESSLSTTENAIVGTVRYMAPEQLADSAAVGPPTDLYALGAILYECIAGKPVVSGSSVQEVMFRIMNGRPVPLSRLAPTLPLAIADVIERCLCKSPSARPASTEKLVELLYAASALPLGPPGADETIVEGNPPTAPLVQRRGSRLYHGGGVLAAVSMAALTGWYARAPAPGPGGGHLPSQTLRPATTLSTAAPHVGMPTPVDPTPPKVSLLQASATLSRSATPSPSSRNTVPTALRRVATSAARNALNGFDSANPYE
jgi:tRNA A-37 threonylcarbamoyl transferase component Bud32